MMLDPSPYDEPDGPVVRPWDEAREYVETYPVRVPPQWVTFGLPPPGLRSRRRARVVGWLWILVLVALAVVQLIGEFVLAGDTMRRLAS